MLLRSFDLSAGYLDAQPRRPRLRLLQLVHLGLLLGGHGRGLPLGLSGLLAANESLLLLVVRLRADSMTHVPGALARGKVFFTHGGSKHHRVKLNLKLRVGVPATIQNRVLQIRENCSWCSFGFHLRFYFFRSCLESFDMVGAGLG